MLRGIARSRAHTEVGYKLDRLHMIIDAYAFETAEKIFAHVRDVKSPLRRADIYEITFNMLVQEVREANRNISENSPSATRLWFTNAFRLMGLLLYEILAFGAERVRLDWKKHEEVLLKM